MHAANLPDLPDAQDSGLGKINWGTDGATLGFKTATERLTASIAYSESNQTALNLDAGFALSDYFALGANLVVSEGFQEALLTGVFSTPDHLRLRLSAGQQQAQKQFQFTYGSDELEMRQNNYLLNLKKSWDRGRVLSELGVTVYAADPSLKNKGLAQESSSELYFDPRMSGTRRQGAVYNISLAPNYFSKLDFGLGYQRAQDAAGAQWGEKERQSLVQYSQYFANCMRLSGGYNGSESSRLYNLGIAKDEWSLTATHTLEQDYAQGNVVLRYAIPLYGGGMKSRSCAHYQLASKSYKPVLSEAIQRPSPKSVLVYSGLSGVVPEKNADTGGVSIDISNRQTILLLQPVKAIIALQSADKAVIRERGAELFVLEAGTIRAMLTRFQQAGSYILDVQQSDGAILQIEVEISKAEAGQGGDAKLVSVKRLNFPTLLGLQKVSPAQFARIPVAELALFNAEQLLSLPPAVIAAMTEAQLAALKLLPVLSPPQLAALPPQRLIAMSPEQLGSLSRPQLGALNADDVVFSPQQQAVLPMPDLAALTMANKTLDDEPFFIPAPASNSKGVISYYSSQPDVASVDEKTGWVTLLKAGETVIEARQAAKGIYTAVSVKAPLLVQAGQEIGPLECRVVSEELFQPSRPEWQEKPASIIE
ncbi:hypothetical protein HA050_12615 [Iodobacter sp. HSC-16F04]|uniref:Uncharacterized protein n=1 Tax=Iodobacter violaceini TaxID=3044271 RepID=A0ABX0KSN6_9NEIS|nr:hypothetical protein [Iodobacter violacea]NHQ86957.1 hypothetical protein [Iodobacter violacea]